MRSNHSLDGTPLQRAPRRTAATRADGLFSDKEIEHITKSPMPIMAVVRHRATQLRQYAGVLLVKGRVGITHIIRETSRRFPIYWQTSRRFVRRTINWLMVDRRRTVAAIVVIMLVGLYLVALSLRTPRPRTVPAVTPSSSTTSRPPTVSLPKETPSFPTLLPSGKTIEQLGGWTRVSPPESDPAYAYADAIGSVQIVVTQQQLPDDLRENLSESLQTLASTYGRPEKLTGAPSEVYLSRSDSGPASIALSNNNLLILIKTNDTTSDSAIADYIRSLR